MLLRVLDHHAPRGPPNGRAEGPCVALAVSDDALDCPGTSVPISGGALTGTKSVQINMNTSVATSTGWEVFENNSSSSNANLTTVGICAGTCGRAAGARARHGTAGFSRLVVPAVAVIVMR
jgi:hypothetical protein